MTRTEHLESRFALMATVVVILLAEWLLIQQQFLSGVLLYSLILLSLLLYSAYRWDYAQHYLLVLTIPPLLRLLSFTLPLSNLSLPFVQLILAIPLTLAGTVLVSLFHQGRFKFEIKWRLMPAYLLLIGLGSMAGFILFQFKQPARMLWNTPLLFIFYVFVLVVAMAFLEEWLFRGIMQTILTNLLGKGQTGLVVALVYTILHINQGTWMFVLVVFFFAWGLSWLTNASQSLIPACLVHGAANIVFFLVLPRL